LTAATPVKGLGVGARVAVLKVDAPGEELFVRVANGGGGRAVGEEPCGAPGDPVET